jgi:branched-chain amino acid aminotransferase
MSNETVSESQNELVVFFDGEYIPSDKAAISVFDHAFLYGDGVFDTICAWNGYLFKLEDHVNRLLMSAHATKMNLSHSKEDIANSIIETVRRNKLTNAYIKVVVTRGTSPEPLLDPSECTSSVIIFARPFLWLISPDKIEKGIHVKIASTRRIPSQSLDAKVKTLNYQNNAMAKIEAIESGADDAIMLDIEGYVCEGPTYNLFIVKNGTLITPQDNILLGITRDTIFELAKRSGWPVKVDRITPYDLFNADEVFFCSTAGGIVPIVYVDGRKVGSGKPGDYTRKLIDDYFEMLEQGEGGTPIYINT